jgi:hypothetical protein
VAPAFATNSVRTRASASAYMARTPTVAGNRRTLTISAWVKRGIISSGDREIISAGSGSSLFCGLRFISTDKFDVCIDDSNYRLRTTQVFRDPSAWYHIVVAIDTTQSTASNRIKLYVNGVQVTAFDTALYPIQNYNTQFNAATIHNIARRSEDDTAYFDGYITELNLIDGQALTPNYFGATNASTGAWQPATYRGTYGTNGFYLPMNVTQNIFSIDYLIVAGGGAGAGYNGGGGGAGGLLASSSTVVQGTTYAITVGAGGSAATASSGSNSTAFSLTSIGGGRSASGGNATDQIALVGGSGGGGGCNNNGTYSTGAAGTSGQGNAGGNAPSAGGNYPSAGGGGASAVGESIGSNSAGTAGAGGAGSASSITGSSVTYAGGGGGAIITGTVGPGGAGGGGAGGFWITTNGTSGTANTGGGGGGGGGNGVIGGSGGSGVVIMRILTSEYSGVTTGSPTVTTDGSYTVVKYTASGSYTA